MSPAEEWLRQRLAVAPAPLLVAMVGALPKESMPVPEALAEGALTLYGRVLGGSGGREDALPLLAADALFTHAFQAQAELDQAGFDSFLARWIGTGRMAEALK
jgi:hypothetical protein